MGVASSTARAFTGESTVLNGAKTDLTGPAKTILTKPTFLPANVGEAGAAKGVVEAGRVAGVMQAAGVLPALGSVVAFGVGTVVGSEICGVLGISGCWYHGSQGADPDPGEIGGEWVFKTSATAFEDSTNAKGYTWAWAFTGTKVSAYTWAELNGGHECAFASAPGGTTHFFDRIFGGTCKEAETVTGYAVRSSMANRVLEYHPSDDPEIPNYSHSAPEDWSEKMAAKLANQPSDTPEGRMGERIASEIEGSEVENPYVTKVELPDCVGVPWTSCRDTLEELELVPERVELDWQTADIEVAPDTVVQTEPLPGVELEPGTKVTVTTNPDEAGMPLVIPEPGANETYADYISKLAPGLNPERINVADAFTDPSKGPDAVLQVEPQPGSRLDPSTSHGVDVQTNPATAPAPIGGWSPPTIPELDLQPLMATGLGCTVFPFGLPCYIVDVIQSLDVTPECPEFDLPLYDENEMHIDGCVLDPVLSIWRPAFLFVASICIVIFFAQLAGVGRGTDAD